MQKTKILYVAILISLICIVFYAALTAKIGPLELECGLKKCGHIAPLIFIAIYSIIPIFFIPITPFSVSAGVLFGPVLGTVYTVIGSTLGGCMAFLVSRYLIKDWVDSKTPARIAIVQEKIKEDGWQFIAISRISPIFPFNVQNYIFGVTDISLKTFFITSFFSLIPGSFTYVYLGYAGKSLFDSSPNTIYKILFAIVLLVVFSFLPKIINVLKKRFYRNMI